MRSSVNTATKAGTQAEACREPRLPPSIASFRPQFIDRRTKDEDDGSIILRLGLSKADQSALKAQRIEITCDPGARPIEIIDSLRLTLRGSFVEDWQFMQARILVANAEIVEHAPRPSIKIDGLPSKTCERVRELCNGQDPAANIAALEHTLAGRSKFSKAKQAAILAAYKAEAEELASDTPTTKTLIEKLCAAGEPRAKARELAADFEPDQSPFQFLFAKRQSFIKADRFAKLFDPARRNADRPLAIVINQLLGTPHIVNRITGICKTAWADFGQSHRITKDAIERLKDLDTIQESEAIKADIQIGGAVEHPAFGAGTITAISDDVATIKFEDRYRTLSLIFLKNNLSAKIGLTWLVKAEERIAAFCASRAAPATNNLPNELTTCEKALIENVLDHAADFLHRPDFVLTDAQWTAIKSAFEHKLSIITGPPGVGKTAVIALINAIATMLYSEEIEEYPALVIALAGRAASTAREAGTCWHGRKALPLPASTIHRALGLRSEGDDGPDAFRGGKLINCGALIIEEASMNSTPLLDAMLRRSNARHYVFVGDENQLPPIGQGKPFRDMIASEIIPTTRLTKNWRTDCQGIRDLCADVLKENAETLSSRLSRYESDGSVRFEVCERNERAARAASIYAGLIDKGITPGEIAILGPHNQGDEAGVRATNNAVRSMLGFSPNRIVVGEQLIVLKNDYKARATDQELIALHPAVAEDAQRTDDDGEKKERTETIYNGERCYVAKCGADYLDLEFPENSEGVVRSVRLLMQNPDGFSHRGVPQDARRMDASAQLPEGIAFGYALSVHKAQGSQFRYVIMLAERGYKGAGVVQGSNVYTGISRAREQVIIVGEPDDFTQAASTDEIPRETLLKDLLLASHKHRDKLVEAPSGSLHRDVSQDAQRMARERRQKEGSK
jgi:hypothetical protein